MSQSSSISVCLPLSLNNIKSGLSLHVKSFSKAQKLIGRFLHLDMFSFQNILLHQTLHQHLLQFAKIPFLLRYYNIWWRLIPYSKISNTLSISYRLQEAPGPSLLLNDGPKPLAALAIDGRIEQDVGHPLHLVLLASPSPISLPASPPFRSQQSSPTTSPTSSFSPFSVVVVIPNPSPFWSLSPPLLGRCRNLIV